MVIESPYWIVIDDRMEKPNLETSKLRLKKASFIEQSVGVVDFRRGRTYVSNDRFN